MFRVQGIKRGRIKREYRITNIESRILNVRKVIEINEDVKISHYGPGSCPGQTPAGIQPHSVIPWLDRGIQRF